MRAALWNARAALLYSLGGWTTLGALMHYNSKYSDSEESKSDPEAVQGPRREVKVTETALGLTVTTIVTYKETQPPITRLLRRVKSFFDPPDEPPSEN
ncbi:small integral membrane protein 26 [Dryobates pubescens]|uniref:small integral membrane protein 26 n=1 Tax=Dryobates pubescens TaxID=118200 RepID=UPI0023B9AEC5|nr:small integral membrane protein 26 [Dryobates pubescens]